MTSRTRARVLRFAPHDSPQKTRLLPLVYASGPENMAVDEAILEGVAAGSSPPTLRFYGWTDDWLSIGMAEPIGDVDRAAAAATGVELLRRPSGGTAVLHAGQLGWSLALPPGGELASGDIVASYLAHSRVTLAALRRLGVDARGATLEEARASLPDPVLAIACFGGLAPHEVVAGDPPKKLVGWGQVRRRGVVMHHATASVGPFDPAALAGLLVADQARLAEALAVRVAGVPVEPAALVEAVATAYGEAGLELAPGQLTAAERVRAEELVAEKYAAKSWTERR